MHIKEHFLKRKPVFLLKNGKTGLNVTKILRNVSPKLQQGYKNCCFFIKKVDK